MGFYENIATNRNDSTELRKCINDAVDNLIKERTSSHRPGMLLGKIQGGKTDAFLGIIAASFDRGFDMAIILTKSSDSLAKQTLYRIRRDFMEFIGNDQVQAHDIMFLPKLTLYELNQKLILVVKKEDDNLERVLKLIEENSLLRKKQLLIVDDEADYATVSFRKSSDGISQGVISMLIDKLQQLVERCDYLQVTATPYSLYLQPEEEIFKEGSALFKPKKPSFTVILPIHDKYVGGDYYFEKSSNPDSPAYFFYKEVPLNEIEALKKRDGRRLKTDEVMTDRDAAILRQALAAFLVGGTIRRIQQKDHNQKIEKYSFLFHTERGKSSHDWQELVLTEILRKLKEICVGSPELFNSIVNSAYDDVSKSLKVAMVEVPPIGQVRESVINSLSNDEIMITKVNSDKEVDLLLDEYGELRLRTPFNVYIGGQILDRGITIRNLIAFYYGRNPNRFQQDTVLQHSRMYGARPLDDLPVTRFYAPLHIYNVMRRIHEFDIALRDAFVTRAHDRGVYFIQKDAANKLVPCSPNKLLFSKLTSIGPRKRLILSGFQTVGKTSGKRNLALADKLISEICGGKDGEVKLINVEKAEEILQLCFKNLDFENQEDDERKAHIAAIEHLSKITDNEKQKGMVWVAAYRERNVTRHRDGRFSNAPDTKQQEEIALSRAINIPVLFLLRQEGKEEDGWEGLPFWWPVIRCPQSCITSVFDAQPPTGGWVPSYL